MTGTSRILPGEGARDLGDLADLVGDVARRAVGAHALLDLGHEVVVGDAAFAEDDEERQPAGRALARHVDGERVDDVVHRQHRAVDLARAHPDPVAVDRRVGAAVDDRRPAVGELDPVAVAPDARERAEVALAVAGAVVVAPQVERHRGQRLGQHQLADLADDRRAVLVERLDLRAERARLQLALVDRAASGRRRRTREQTSVPPLIEKSQVSLPTWS